MKVDTARDLLSLPLTKRHDSRRVIMNKRVLGKMGKKFQQAFTLIEVLVVAGILSGIVAISVSMMLATSRNQARIKVEGVMRTEAERALFRLANKLNQARMLMGNDPTTPGTTPATNIVGLGNDYRRNLNLTAAPAPIANTALPIIMPEGSLAPEKNCNSAPASAPNNFFRENTVGNSLLFARYVGRFSNFSVADDPGTPLPMDESIINKRSLDIYEFKYIYITDDPTLTPFTNPRIWFLDQGYNNTTLLRKQRLMEWTSKRYVDYDQFSDYLNDLTSPADRGSVRAGLAAAGINFAWRRSGTVYGGGGRNIFYEVQTGATTAAAVPIVTTTPHQIVQQSVTSLMHFDQDIYSIAYNTQPTQGTAMFFPIQNRVPYFYNDNPPPCGGVLPAPATTQPLNTTTANSFPRGFEVMIVGPPSGRNVHMRITTVALINSKTLVDHADSTTAFARDL